MSANSFGREKRAEKNRGQNLTLQHFRPENYRLSPYSLATKYAELSAFQIMQ